MWDTHTGRLVRKLAAHAMSCNDVKFMPDGRGLVSGGRDNRLKYWDTSFLLIPQTGEQSQRELEFLGHEVRAWFQGFLLWSNLSVYRNLSIAFPSLPMADGLLQLRLTEVFVSGILVMQ